MNKIVEYQNEEPCGFSPDQVKVIKSLIARDLTDDELMVFLHNCKRTGLDPMSRQIYAIKRGGRMTIQAGIDGLRIIAERTGRYAPGKPTDYQYDSNGNLVSATAYIKKMTADGTWHEIAETSFLCEFKGNTPLWKSMPTVMLSKVSESRALRRGFPDVLCNVYSEEEMDQAPPAESNVKPLVSTISGQQVNQLKELMSDNEDLLQEVMQTLKEHYKITSLENIPSDMFDRLYKYISSKLPLQEAEQC